MTTVILERSFGFYLSAITLFISFTGLLLAFLKNDSQTIQVFGIQAVFLLQINLIIQFLVRESINNQSQLVSA